MNKRMKKIIISRNIFPKLFKFVYMLSIIISLIRGIKIQNKINDLKSNNEQSIENETESKINLDKQKQLSQVFNLSKY